jgi:hypothetical protein
MDILLRVVDKEVSVQIHIFVVFLNLSSKLPVLKDEVNNYTFSLCLNFFHLLARKPNLEKKKYLFLFFTCPNQVLLVPGFGQVG